MGDQLTTSAAALRMFFTDDIYLVSGEESVAVTHLGKSDENEQKSGVSDAAVTKNADHKPTIPHLTETTSVNQESHAAEIPVTKNVVQEKAVPEQQTLPPVVFKSLGKNQKNVLILVKDEQHDVSTEKGRELLRNIVKALQLTANDFALVNYHGYDGQHFGALTSFFSSKLVMAFGVGPLQLGLADYPANTIVMEGEVQVVFSQNLDLLADDQSEKKALWGSMKKIRL
jgi:hypothetical protein